MRLTGRGAEPRLQLLQCAQGAVRAPELGTRLSRPFCVPGRVSRECGWQRPQMLHLQCRAQWRGDRPGRVRRGRKPATEGFLYSPGGMHTPARAPIRGGRRCSPAWGDCAEPMASLAASARLHRGFPRPAHQARPPPCSGCCGRRLPAGGTWAASGKVLGYRAPDAPPQNCFCDCWLPRTRDGGQRLWGKRAQSSTLAALLASTPRLFFVWLQGL